MSAYQRYECFNCNKDFDVAENGMCPYCHSTNILDRKDPCKHLDKDDSNIEEGYRMCLLTGTACINEITPGICLKSEGE